ncbi:sensor histidine kinase [Polaribacter glomeratus]|uniref:sensor histidine kinase n=1 Tax=Polaribacter glomeratus TaxID=102 RepID=UPI000CF453B0|nr:histidine kinase [Polaribacter glomeratus]TXD65911.1 histidine kinase transcriptional regulator protein [Polaribacter glomeratus]
MNQEYITYQYRLLPSQKNWTSTKTKTLNFSNLSPEFYTLEVKATDQHFNKNIKKIYLNVIPTWWQTTFSKSIFSVLIFSFLGLFMLLIKNRIQKKIAAKAELDRKMAGLELQSLRSQMNPHFVHNSLNAIQYFIQRNEVELSEDYLVKFSKLVRLFFEYSRKQTLTIEEEVTLLENYLQIEKLRFEDKLSYCINVDEKIDKEELQIPSMLLQPIVENAVNHGLFHKKGNGLVTVDFKLIDSNTYMVTIKDDGIGIKKAKEFYKNSVKNYQSSSTIVLQERLSLLQKSKNWEVTYSIEDLSETNRGEGTEVNISFKQKYL